MYGRSFCVLVYLHCTLYFAFLDYSRIKFIQTIFREVFALLMNTTVADYNRKIG